MMTEDELQDATKAITDLVLQEILKHPNATTADMAVIGIDIALSCIITATMNMNKDRSYKERFVDIAEEEFTKHFDEAIGLLRKMIKEKPKTLDEFDGRIEKGPSFNMQLKVIKHPLSEQITEENNKLEELNVTQEEATYLETLNNKGQKH